MQTITIPYIEGDGIGAEITAAMKYVVTEAVKTAYPGAYRIDFLELLAGEKARAKVGVSLPEETVRQIEAHKVAIKGGRLPPRWVWGSVRSMSSCVKSSISTPACARWSTIRAFRPRSSALSSSTW
ncbi:MAG: isocitrate/isopropylmalate family dehydrogenase [Sphaerochaeta sp.]